MDSKSKKRRSVLWKRKKAKREQSIELSTPEVLPITRNKINRRYSTAPVTHESSQQKEKRPVLSFLEEEQPDGTDGSASTAESDPTSSETATDGTSVHGPRSRFLYCWGGQKYTTPRKVPALSGVSVSAVAVGEQHFLALSDDGNVFSWGQNTHFQLGYYGAECENATLIDVLSGEKAVDIAAGKSFSCMVTRTGSLYVWGLVDGDISFNSPTVLNCVEYDRPRSSSAFGLPSSLHDDAGTHSEQQQLHHHHQQQQQQQQQEHSDPVLFGNDLHVTKVAAGDHHLLVLCRQRLKSSRRSSSHSIVLTLGRGAEGQLGHVGLDDSPTPRAVAALRGLHVTDVFASQTASAVITKHGYVFLWGRTYYGDGHPMSKGAVPVRLVLNDPITHLSLGDRHCAAITSADQLFVWGDNVHGQLGLHDTAPRHTPQLVEALSGERILGISCGDFHTLAWTEKEIYSWGNNEYHQLGHGDIDKKLLVNPKCISSLRGRIVHNVSSRVIALGCISTVSLSVHLGCLTQRRPIQSITTTVVEVVSIIAVHLGLDLSTACVRDRWFRFLSPHETVRSLFVRGVSEIWIMDRGQVAEEMSAIPSLHFTGTEDLKDLELPLVTGGSVEALLQWLTNPRFPYQAFAEQFLATYRSYTSAEDLLKALSDIGPFALKQCTEGVGKSDQEHIRRERSIYVISKWISDYPQDFFAPGHETLLDAMHQHINSLIATSRDRDESLRLRKVFFKMDPLRAIVRLPELDRGSWLHPDDLFERYSATDIAEQETLIAFAAFSAIETREFNNCAWSKKNRHVDAPNITKFIQRCNLLKEWCDSMLLLASPEKRLSVFSGLIGILSHLLKLHNYASAMAVMSSFNSTNVKILQEVMEKEGVSLPMRDMLNLECANELLNSKNYGSLRLRLSEVNPPCVPFLGMFLRDLTFIYMGNEDYVEEGVVNFRKHRLLSQPLLSFLRFRSVRFNFAPINELLGTLQHVRGLALPGEPHDSKAYSMATEIRGGSYPRHVIATQISFWKEEIPLIPSSSDSNSDDDGDDDDGKKKAGSARSDRRRSNLLRSASTVSHYSLSARVTFINQQAVSLSSDSVDRTHIFRSWLTQLQTAFGTGGDAGVLAAFQRSKGPSCLATNIMVDFPEVAEELDPVRDLLAVVFPLFPTSELMNVLALLCEVNLKRNPALKELAADWVCLGTFSADPGADCVDPMPDLWPQHVQKALKSLRSKLVALSSMVEGHVLLDLGGEVSSMTLADRSSGGGSKRSIARAKKSRKSRFPSTAPPALPVKVPPPLPPLPPIEEDVHFAAGNVARVASGEKSAEVAARTETRSAAGEGQQVQAAEGVSEQEAICPPRDTAECVGIAGSSSDAPSGGATAEEPSPAGSNLPSCAEEKDARATVGRNAEDEASHPEGAPRDEAVPVQESASDNADDARSSPSDGPGDEDEHGKEEEKEDEDEEEKDDDEEEGKDEDEDEDEGQGQGEGEGGEARVESEGCYTQASSDEDRDGTAGQSESEDGDEVVECNARAESESGGQLQASSKDEKKHSQSKVVRPAQLSRTSSRTRSPSPIVPRLRGIPQRASLDNVLNPKDTTATEEADAVSQSAGADSIPQSKEQQAEQGIESGILERSGSAGPDNEGAGENSSYATRKTSTDLGEDSSVARSSASFTASDTEFDDRDGVMAEAEEAAAYAASRGNRGSTRVGGMGAAVVLPLATVACVTYCLVRLEAHNRREAVEADLHGGVRETVPMLLSLSSKWSSGLDMKMLGSRANSAIQLGNLVRLVLRVVESNFAMYYDEGQGELVRGAFEAVREKLDVSLQRG